MLQSLMLRIIFELSDALLCSLACSITNLSTEVESRVIRHEARNSSTFTSRQICGGTSTQTGRRPPQPQRQFRRLLHSIENKVCEASIASEQTVKAYVSTKNGQIHHENMFV